MRSTKHLSTDLGVYAIFFGVALCAAYLDPHRPVPATTTGPFATDAPSPTQNLTDIDAACKNAIDSFGSTTRTSTQDRAQQTASTAKDDLAENPPCRSERESKDK